MIFAETSRQCGSKYLFKGSTVNSGNRRPPAPNGRKRRNGKIDRTHEWFQTLQHLNSHGKTSAYASGIRLKIKNS